MGGGIADLLAVLVVVVVAAGTAGTAAVSASGSPAAVGLVIGPSTLSSRSTNPSGAGGIGAGVEPVRAGARLAGGVVGWSAPPSGTEPARAGGCRSVSERQVSGSARGSADAGSVDAGSEADHDRAGAGSLPASACSAAPGTGPVAADGA